MVRLWEFRGRLALAAERVVPAAGLGREGGKGEETRSGSPVPCLETLLLRGLLVAHLPAGKKGTDEGARRPPAFVSLGARFVAEVAELA